MNVNKNSVFCRYQKNQLSKMRTSLVMFIIFGAMLCALTAICIWCMLEKYDVTPFTVLCAVYAAVTAFFGYIFFKNKSAYRRVYDKYTALDEREKLFIDSEILSSKAGGNVILGDKYFYFAERFLDFIPYTDIVWIFEKVSYLSVPSGTRPENIPHNVWFSTVVFFDRNAVQHKLYINAASDIMKPEGSFYAKDIIKFVQKKNPAVIAGYSKKRYAMAKHDFEEFMYEGRFE